MLGNDEESLAHHHAQILNLMGAYRLMPPRNLFYHLELGNGTDFHHLKTPERDSLVFMETKNKADR